MVLPARSAAPDDWSAEIGESAEALMNAMIKVYDPDTTVTVPYDAATDTGGYDAPLLLLTTKARIQHVRQPTDAYSLEEWSMNTNIICQIPLNATTMLIRKGLQVRVNDGGKDSVLEKIVLTVESAINSSHAALRTIKCVTPVAEAPAV